MPGIVGWIAARCAAESFQNSSFSKRDLGLHSLADKILDILDEFYCPSDIPFATKMHFREHFGFGMAMPVALRLASGVSLRPLDQVIADLVLDRVAPEEKRYCSWLKEFSLPPRCLPNWLPSVVARWKHFYVSLVCHTVPSFIRYLGEPRLLKVQDTQRILKICRETQDSVILQGASNLLTSATFERLAKPVLVQKILSAAPNIWLVMRLFDTRASNRVQNRDSDDEKLALSVARLILRQPEGYSFYVVNAAAGFLAEVEAQRSKPLFEEPLDLLGST